MDKAEKGDEPLIVFKASEDDPLSVNGATLFKMSLEVI
jgi:hypothetical protein